MPKAERSFIPETTVDSGTAHAPPHLRQEPTGRIRRPVRGDAVAAADPLDGGRRPSSGRISGAATRGRYGPFQRAGNAAEGPAENPAAPNQHDHLTPNAPSGAAVDIAELTQAFKRETEGKFR